VGEEEIQYMEEENIQFSIADFLDQTRGNVGHEYFNQTS